jgi:hypothetical protein
MMTYLQKQSEQDHAELNELKSKFRECEQSLHYLQGLIDDSSEIELFDKSSNKYTKYLSFCALARVSLLFRTFVSFSFQSTCFVFF